MLETGLLCGRGVAHKLQLPSGALHREFFETPPPFPPAPTLPQPHTLPPALPAFHEHALFQAQYVNCGVCGAKMQEFAFAIREEKPVVALILDQESWDLLTVPGGTRKAWTMNKWGPTLKEYEGQDIVPGIKFSQDKVDDLFGYLSGINLCPCRESEVKPPRTIPLKHQLGVHDG